MRLRLLANENIPRAAIAALRDLGHDVVWTAEDAPSTADTAVLARAVAEERVLLTLDKDFGALAFHARLPATCGVVPLRVRPLPARVAALVCRALPEAADFAGRYVVVEEDRIRVRALPPAGR